MDSLKELADSGEWAIRVPTTVVIELEGLTKAADGTRFDITSHISKLSHNINFSYVGLA